MLHVGQNKGTECNEMRNFSLNVIVARIDLSDNREGDKSQTQ